MPPAPGMAMLHPSTPLLLATLLLLAAVILPRLRSRWPLWVRVVARIAYFIVLTLLVDAVVGSTLQPHYSSAAGDRFWEQVVEACWWIAGSRVLVGLARLFVVLENRPRETRIVSDLVAGAIAVATLLAVVNFAFEVPIRGLLATSGVIAIVLGLALQSTLSDVFSGIAVGLERPYKPGDLLWVEGGIEGHVVQVNWRSTQIATGENNIAVVPNSIIAKARLVNRSAPTSARGDTLTVSVDAAAIPDRCLKALQAAVLTCRVIQSRPAASINCTGIRGDGVTWEIGFTVETSAQLSAARTELYTNILRHLRHAGIALAVAGLATPVTVPVPTLAELLQDSDLFGVVDAAERESLIPYFQAEWLQAGETLIRQGDNPEAMFLIAAGAAEITVEGVGGSRVVYRMSPGECIGAIGLITGTPFAATATALTPLHAWRIGKADIAAAIKARPELATALEELARRGQNALRRDVGSSADHAEVRPEMFLTRLRSFLQLLKS
ncbi:mechanosensitive ion channel family protein [Lichenicola sp.]|uniref:mechanosensitive ion channel family protein n=1 Tax=Lichenicola sp. TaxID=2804529 RepID=UPI003B00E6BD